MPSAVIDLTEMVRMAMRRPEHSPLFRAWEEGLFTWVTSELVLAEFVVVTNRPKFRRMIRPQVRDALVEAWRTRAVIAAPASEFPHCRDPQDDAVIAVAVAAHVDYIVTTDRDLLNDDVLQTALIGYGVRVASPPGFLSLLG
jgi:putative PIN family toxin of toxin-antitoxin system